MIRATIAAALALASIATPALARDTPRLAAAAQECAAMRRAGLIPAGASALIIGHQMADLSEASFPCLARGQRLQNLRPRFVATRLHEDEPRLLVVLGTVAQPLGCMTDAECAMARPSSDPAVINLPAAIMAAAAGVERIGWEVTQGRR